MHRIHSQVWPGAIAHTAVMGIFTRRASLNLFNDGRNTSSVLPSGTARVLPKSFWLRRAAAGFGFNGQGSLCFCCVLCVFLLAQMWGMFPLWGLKHHFLLSCWRFRMNQKQVHHLKHHHYVNVHVLGANLLEPMCFLPRAKWVSPMLVSWNGSNGGGSHRPCSSPQFIAGIHGSS